MLTSNLQAEEVASNRVVYADDYAYVAEEPGYVDCPDLECNIPVNLVVHKVQRGDFIEKSRTLISSQASGSHTLLKSDNRLSALYSNRIQPSIYHDATFITHLKSFDISQPESPTEFQDIELPGQLSGYDLHEDRLSLLTLTSLPENTFNHRCRELAGESDSSNRLELNVLTKRLGSEKHLRQCVILPASHLKAISLVTDQQSIIISYQDSNVLSAVQLSINDSTLEFVRQFPLGSAHVYNNEENQSTLSNGFLLTAGNFKFDSAINAGIKVFDILSDLSTKRPPSWLLPLTSSNDEEPHAIHSMSSATDDRWFLTSSAIQGKDANAQVSSLYTINLTQPGKPYVATRSSLEGKSEVIIDHQNNLLSVYSMLTKNTIGLSAVSKLTLFNSNTEDELRPILEDYISEGFEQQPLVYSDRKTQTMSFNSLDEGKFLIAVNTTQAPFFDKLETSLGLNGQATLQQRDIPTSQTVGIHSYELSQKPGCSSWCWHAQKKRTDELVLPYEGDEPNRARFINRNDRFYYVLGNTFFNFHW